ncbi:Progestin and adipoQ receptor member 3 [Homalodisca vitripennis]|nr:Progestin and adipoQ receptor member 3 [Homalodisca vitripennis]
MVMSSLYHIFSCRSEHTFNYFLSFDLLGIALSMLGIYMTGVYYAYWCNKTWQTFYLTTVCAFFVIAMILQLPWLQVDDNVKMLIFVMWAAYGVVPTAHWTVMMGGLENPIVSVGVILFVCYFYVKQVQSGKLMTGLTMFIKPLS